MSDEKFAGFLGVFGSPAEELDKRETELVKLGDLDPKLRGECWDETIAQPAAISRLSLREPLGRNGGVPHRRQPLRRPDDDLQRGGRQRHRAHEEGSSNPKATGRASLQAALKSWGGGEKRRPKDADCQCQSKGGEGKFVGGRGRRG